MTKEYGSRHIVAKAMTGVLAAVVVSIGSIEVYSAVNSLNNPASTKSAAVQSESEKPHKSNLLAETVANILEPEEQSAPALLTTEEAVAKVLPSVVGIESEFGTQEKQEETQKSERGKKKSGGFGGFGDYDFGYDFGDFDFGDIFSGAQGDAMTGTGTGVVLTEDGYIVTNAHVIYDSEYGFELAKHISVVMSSSVKQDATVVGYDTDCDIAVLKIEAHGLTPAQFGDSDSLKLGQSVVAIGNPLGFDLMNTVTAGIVSGLNRQITVGDKDMILLQTDAAINSGNSGGPLLNLYGEVIGINSSKMSASYLDQASIEGIGFAISSNDAGKIVNDLMSCGYVTGKPSLGITCVTVTEEVSELYGMQLGIYVSTVNDGSAAERAGICEGDIITAVDGDTVTTVEELNAKKNQHKAGDTITLTVYRNGSSVDCTATLDEISLSE